MRIEPFFIQYTKKKKKKKNPKLIKDLKPLKHLEENIGRILYHTNISKISLSLSPKAKKKKKVSN